MKDGNISKLDFDQMEANFRTSRAALTQAKQDLEYTELRAPFTGRIARRFVQNRCPRFLLGLVEKTRPTLWVVVAQRGTNLGTYGFQMVNILFPISKEHNPQSA